MHCKLQMVKNIFNSREKEKRNLVVFLSLFIVDVVLFCLMSASKLYAFLQRKR